MFPWHVVEVWMRWSLGPWDWPINRCRRDPSLIYGILIVRSKAGWVRWFLVLGQVQVVPNCISADVPGHSNMVPEAVKVMNERLGQKHPKACGSCIMWSVGLDRWAELMNPMSIISYAMVIWVISLSKKVLKCQILYTWKSPNLFWTVLLLAMKGVSSQSLQSVISRIGSHHRNNFFLHSLRRDC